MAPHLRHPKQRIRHLLWPKHDRRPLLESAASNFGCTIEANGNACTMHKKKNRFSQPVDWATWGSPRTQNFYSIVKSPPKDAKMASTSAILNAVVANNWRKIRSTIFRAERTLRYIKSTNSAYNAVHVRFVLIFSPFSILPLSQAASKKSYCPKSKPSHSFPIPNLGE